MKLAEALKLVRAPADPTRETFETFLACGFEPLHAKTFLTAHLAVRLPGRAIDVRTGLYGDLPGNVQRLAASGCDTGTVIVEWEDLDARLGLRRIGGWSPNLLPDVLDSSKSRLRSLLRDIENTAKSTALVVVPPSLPLPPLSPHGLGRANASLLQLQEAMSSFLAQAAATAGVKVLDSGQLDRRSPPGERLDVRSQLTAGFPYRISHAACLGLMIAALLYPSPPKKGLVTDLDNTLWRGVLGDDGLHGIAWDLDNHAHAHGLYQQLLCALADSGVLLAVASKNDPTLVHQALARDDMILPKDRCFPLELHWREKSGSLSRILEAWNIGPESVVFVDDSPLELAEVRAAHPELECIQFPTGDDQAIYALIEQLRSMFGKDALTSEDALRLNSLRTAHEVRQVVQSGAENQDAFLSQLAAEVVFEVDPHVDDPRPIELINKTNQFNLNGRRLSLGEYRALRQGSEALLLQVSYEDKFGALGKIAILAGHQDGRRLTVSIWVMSCRAFSRRIEHRCLAYLFEKYDADEIRFDLQPTERNGPTLDFFEMLLGERPRGPFSLERAQFAPPALFHGVREVINE